MYQKIKKFITPYMTLLGLGSTVLISGVLGYIFHPLMVRFLSDVDFVHVQFLLSLMNILGVVAGVSLFVQQELLSMSGDTTKQANFVYVIQQKFWGLIPYLLAICLVLAGVISYSFELTNFWIVLLTSVGLITGLYNSVLGGILRAHSKYTQINILGIFGQLTKLLIAGGFVILGRGVRGAMGGIVLAGVLGVGLSSYFVYQQYHLLLKDIQESPGDLLQEFDQDFRMYIKSFIYTLLVVFLVTMFVHIDIFMVSKVLDTELAAIYSSLSLVAKFIFFICAALEIYFYNNIVGEQQINSSHLYKPLIIYILLVLCGLVGIYLFGPRVLDVFKPGLSVYIRYLYVLYVYFVIMGMVSLYTKVLIAWKQYYILRYLSAMILYVIGGLLYRAKDIADILMMLLTGGGVLLVLVCVYVYIGHQKHILEHSISQDT